MIGRTLGIRSVDSNPTLLAIIHKLSKLTAVLLFKIQVTNMVRHVKLKLIVILHIRLACKSLLKTAIKARIFVNNFL